MNFTIHLLREDKGKRGTSRTALRSWGTGHKSWPQHLRGIQICAFKASLITRQVPRQPGLQNINRLKKPKAKSHTQNKTKHQGFSDGLEGRLLAGQGPEAGQSFHEYYGFRSLESSPCIQCSERKSFLVFGTLATNSSKETWPTDLSSTVMSKNTMELNTDDSKRLQVTAPMEPQSSFQEPKCLIHHIVQVRVCACVHVCKSEGGLLESVLSLHHVCCWDQIQVICPQSHLTSPENLFALQKLLYVYKEGKSCSL